ncbi:hypothetical protein, partial [Streptomyces sp. NPDC005009]
PMQMLRCTRDTALPPPDDHHQDHALHHFDDGHHPPVPTNDTRCPPPASRTIRAVRQQGNLAGTYAPLSHRWIDHC